MFIRNRLGGVLAANAIMGNLAAEEWRGWNIHVEDYVVSHGIERFAKLVEERTGGKLTANTFRSGVPSSQSDTIEQLRLGL